MKFIAENEAREDMELARTALQIAVQEYENGYADYAEVKRAQRALKTAEKRLEAVRN